MISYRIRTLAAATLTGFLTMAPVGDRAPSPRPSIEAAGLGNPWMNVADGTFLPTRFLGAEELVRYMESGFAQPNALAVGDFDEDGVPDLVHGYASDTGGIVGIQRGNLDVRYPNTASAGRRRLAATSVDEPFFAPAHLFESDVAPHFLVSGDFDADGHVDLVAASRSDSLLSWLAGTGDGSFEEPRTVSLPGVVTALEASDINRRDGLADLAVGVAAPGGAQLLVFEGQNGAIAAEPETTYLGDEATALVMDQLDAHYAIDVAVAAGPEVVVIAGRDRMLTHTPVHRLAVPPPSKRTHRLPGRVAAITSGEFTGDVATDLALIYESGRLTLIDGNTGEATETPYTFPWSGPENAPVLVRSRVSTLPKDDLLVLDRENSQIHVLHSSHLDQNRSERGGFAERFHPELNPVAIPVPAPVTLGLSFRPQAMQMMRLNLDAFGDLVVLERTSESRPARVATALTQPLNTFVVNADRFAFDANSGDGVCQTSQGDCTMKAAIMEANASPGPDEITFAINNLTEGWSEIIKESVTIDGSSQGRTVIGRGNLVFWWNSNVVHGIALDGAIQLNGFFFNGELQDEGGSSIIEGNHIGVDADGLNEPGTLSNRIDVQSPNNTIGGSTENARNVTMGIRVTHPDNDIRGNYIGINAPGTGYIPDAQGVTIIDEATNVTLGGVEPGAGNVIGGLEAGRTGVVVGGGAKGILIQGNRIGTDSSGESKVGVTGFAGAEVNNASSVTIGGTVEGARNILAGGYDPNRTVPGVLLGRADSAVVQGNYIGVSANGLDSLSNTGHGIAARTASAMLIGGTSSSAGNVISGNGLSGIFLTSDSLVSIHGNLIGVSAAGSGRLGNREHGIAIDGGENQVIGGADAGEGNVIGANGAHGVYFDFTDNNRVIGNSIGTNLTGQIDLGNEGSGIYFETSVRDNLVGGTEEGEGNVIAFNGQDGIRAAFARRTNTWSGNSIYENEGLGINLESSNGDDDVTPNDDGDRDSNGPNDLQNFPDLSVEPDGSLNVSLNSVANLTYRVELFGSPACDASNHGQGKFFLEAHAMTTDADGNAILITQPLIDLGQQFITAVATDPNGNSSEFSNCAEVESPPTLSVLVLQFDDAGGLEPVPNTFFQIGRFTPGAPGDPFEILTSQTTDDEGLLQLPTPPFNPGEAFMIRTYPHTELAVRPGHADVDGEMFNVEVDNLFIDYNPSSKSAVFRTDTLLSDPAEITEAVLSHTAYVYNLVVSIQFKAEDAYVEGLTEAFRSASDYLFDVTNGQFYLGKVAIYDNGRYWSEADFRIYADNTLRAYVDEVSSIEKRTGHAHFSPRSFGGGSADRNGVYREDPLNPNSSDNFRTFMHEFGHYAMGLYDEYRTQEGQEIQDGTNYGFMDFHFQGGLFAGRALMSSEMSLYGDSDYQRFEQYQRRGKTSWEDVADRFSRRYGNVQARIISPAEFGVPVFDPFILGPNEYNRPIEYPTGALMEFMTANAPGSAVGKQYQIVRNIGGELRGISNASVAVEKRDADGKILNISHGGTTDAGFIRLLGADIGDKLSVGAQIDRNYLSKLVPIESASSEVEVVVLGPVVGVPDMVSRVEVDDPSQPEFVLIPESLLGSPAALKVVDESGDAREYELVESADRLVATLDVSAPGEADLTFSSTDADGEPFQVRQKLSLFALAAETGKGSAAIGPAALSTSENFTFFVDSTASGVAGLAVLSSPYPPPVTGLPDSTRLVSRVFSINAWPASATLGGRIRLGYDVPDKVARIQGGFRMYRWDGSEWSPLETVDEMLTQRVSADFNGPGAYGVFMDLTVTGTSVDPDDTPDPAIRGTHLFQNYPNPVKRLTTFKFVLERQSRVRLSIFNVLGQEIHTVSSGTAVAGEHEIVYDAAGLVPGLYVYRLEAEGRNLFRNMLVIR